MKLRRRGQLLAGALERQDAAVVGQRMQHDGDVLARLHDLVEIADAAFAHRAGQRAIDPDRVAALEQIASGQIGRREIVVAGDGVQRQPEPRRHVGDEAGLAAAGRALEQQRQAPPPGMLEQRAFVAARDVGRDVRSAAAPTA